MQRSCRSVLFMAGVVLLAVATGLTLFPNEERLNPPIENPEAPVQQGAATKRDTSKQSLFDAATKDVNEESVAEPPQKDASAQADDQHEDTPTPNDPIEIAGDSKELLAVLNLRRNDLDYARIARLSLADILEAAGDLSDPENHDRAIAAMRELENLRREAGRRRAEELGLPLRVELPDGRVREVVSIDENGQPLYYETHNVNAAISTAADVLQAAPYQLTGTNLVLGMWDGGAGRTSHQEFAGGRMSNMNNVASINHATHVGGTMIAAGVDADAKGMATAARVDSYDWHNDLSEMTSRGAAAPNEAGKIYISNHSYGYVRGWYWNGSNFVWYGSGTTTNAVDGQFGRYNTFARDMDAIVFNKPYYTVFWSAGNDRNDNPSTGNPVALSPGGSTVPYDPNQHPPGDGVYRGGYDIIADHAVGKNVLTIGAVNDAVSGEERSLAAATMSWFSSWGPTDDGRIKPDLVANGVGLWSPVATSDGAYDSSSGTSMSSPNAAGTAALLIEEYKRLFPGGALRASTLKGLLIHTADDLGTPGPDYQYGWGLINALEAVELLNDYASRPGNIRLTEDTISSANRPITYEAQWDGESPIRVTLTWTDPAGPATTATDNRTSRLVNNLDVKVIGPDGTEYLPWVMPFVGTWTQTSMSLPATTGTNNTDNVEQVFIAAPSQPGTYTIVVNYQGTLSNSPQTYSLLVSGMDVPTDPADVLLLDANLEFGEVLINTDADRVVTLRNSGTDSVVVTNFVLPPGFSGAWTGALPAGASRDMVVRFSPLTVTPYDGQLVLELADTEATVSAPITATGVDYLTITNPPSDITVPFSTDSLDIAGEANVALTGFLTWTNTGTGASGTLPADETWQANNVALAEGANLFTIFGTNNPMDTFIAEDSAAATWSEGDNGGYGFNGWIWTTTGENAGHFVATSGSNLNLDIDSPAWGLWANSGHQANAFRPLAEPLQTGDTFRVTLENNWITTGNSVGVALLNPDGEYLFEFYFVGDESNYRINDSVSGHTTTLSYTDAGLELVLTRTGESTYDLTANATALGSRTFASRTDMQITRFRAFNHSAGVGSNYDFFFNDLSVERGAAEPETFSDTVEITRLGPPPATPELLVGLVETNLFEAFWTAPMSATGYVFAANTDASFGSATIVPGYSNLVMAATNITVTGLEAGTEYFLRVKAVSENGESDYAVTNATTLGEARETQTITFDPIEGDIVTTNIVELSATASSGLPVSFHVESGLATITNGNEVVFSTSGAVTIKATQEGDEEYQPAPPVSRSFFVNKAIPAILTPPEASDLSVGQSLAISSLTGGSADTDGNFEWLDDSIVPPGGVSTQAVVFLPEDTNIYANAETEVAVTVQFASLEIDPVDEQIVALDPFGSTNLLYTLTNSGNVSLEWSVELLAHDFFDDMEHGINGWTVGGDNALWSISTNRATSGDHAWYSGYTTFMWSRVVTPPIQLHTNEPSLVFDHWIDAEIVPGTGIAWHGGLVAISRNGVNFFLLEPDGGYPYSLAGTSLGVYSGSNDWSSATFDLSDDAGEWVWLAFYFITDDAYSGIEEGWYVDNVAVSPREADDDWIQLSPMSNTVPPETSGTLTAQLAAPTHLAGATRQAVLTIESNDEANPVQTRAIQLQVNKNSADISLLNLTQFYDGRPKSPTALTDPSGLNVVFTYNDSPTPPVEVGDYTVIATINELAWDGATTGTFSIVELRGAIEVEDSILPADDLDMPFGDVFIHHERIEHITIFNTNLVNELTVLNVFVGGEPMEESAVQATASATAAARAPHELRRAALESEAPRAPDTLLVRFAPQAESVAARNAVHTLMGSERRHRYRTIPVEVVELPPGADLAEMIAAYEARPEVEYAEPNFMYSPMNTPNDPSFDQLWGLHNTGQSGGTPGADISALQAWATTTGSSNVIVAVVDTGIDYNHPDLAANMWINPNPDPEVNDIYGARWTDGDGSMTSGDPMDGQSHGTHVAGTIGAVGNNALGVVGVNWQVRMMALKFLPDSGSGYLADAIAAIEYAIEHGAHLSNNSWGGGGYSQALKDMIDAAGAANQLFVAAAGNDNSDNDSAPAYPASYNSPNVISVANSTHTDARSGSSNYGVNSVHLAAPGSTIYSTIPNNGYGNKGGTSMAAPHVAGTAALLLSLHENAPYAQLKDWILSSVTPLSNWENLVITGGRLNAAQAIATSLENGFSVAYQPPVPFIIPPGQSVTLDIRFRPPAVDTYTNTLTIVHNDLDQPDIIFSLSGTGLSVPPTATILTAAQTSTDGSGIATIEVDVEDPDSPSIDLEVLFSTDNGTTWTNAWIASAESATITNGVTPQVLGIDTSTGSNQVAIGWATTNEPALLLSTATLVRVRAWDGYSWSAPADSAPFLVDNEPPTAPSGLASGTHTAEDWSTLNAFEGEWIAADDGDGIGVLGYGVSLEIGQSAPPSSIITTGLTFNASELADGTNWWLGARAIDAYGNVGPAAYLGPFHIDATPPSATGAVVEVLTSAYGNYVIGDVLTNEWSGFADELSGIAGYYIALADASGTTNGIWTMDTSGVLTEAILDQTNTVYVWARDVAGNIGAAAFASILVLDPDTDSDGSGMTTRQKEIAGLDATDPEAVFKSEPKLDSQDPDTITLHWPYAAGRVYTIYWSEHPLGDPGFAWSAVNDPHYTVENGFATWSDTNQLNGINARRVYRLEVELE